jgi:hypothetical protein
MARAAASKDGRAWLLGPGRPLLVLLLVVGVFGGGVYLAWRKFKGRILDLPEYHIISSQQIEITPPPDWIHSDIREEAFRDPSLAGPLSIMDDTLAERIGKAFARHPWVARVVSVVKRPPALLKLELVYRKPVCVVRVPGGLLPVDIEGTLLPNDDFTPPEVARYPALEGVDYLPTQPAGSRWADARVIGGAEIAAAIGPAWETLKLRSLVPLAADPATDAGSANSIGGDANSVGGDSSRRSAEPFFVLMTRGSERNRAGRRVLWGYAPGANAIGELSAAEKLARLQRYAADNDGLDSRETDRQDLDIRKLTAK